MSVHPSRSDLAGSILTHPVHRIKLARIATETSTTGGIEKFRRSCSATPYRSVLIQRASAHEADRPATAFRPAYSAGSIPSPTRRRAAAGPERCEPHAELAGSLKHSVTHDPAYPGRGQTKREQRKAADQPCHRPRRLHCAGHDRRPFAILLTAQFAQTSLIISRQALKLPGSILQPRDRRSSVAGEQSLGHGEQDSPLTHRAVR